MKIHIGTPMRIKSLLPLRRSLIDANPTERLERKPYVRAKTREELMGMLQAGWNKNKLRQAHIKFLHAKGMGLDEISQRLSCTLITVMKYTEVEFLMSTDPWPVAPDWWVLYDEAVEQAQKDPIALETIRRLQESLGDV